MIAFKFLAPGAIAPFTGIAWPAGEWLHAVPVPGAGIHACALEDLPFWMDDELWKVELSGPISREERQLVAGRGRLLARVEGWPASAADFSAACMERTRSRVADALDAAGNAEAAAEVRTERDLERLQKLAQGLAAAGTEVCGYLFDVIRRRPYPGLCAYVAANAAVVAGGPSAHDQERAAQSAWLLEHLRLDTI
jgi:hypothetical protein